jgi:hypothetical protein
MPAHLQSLLFLYKFLDAYLKSLTGKVVHSKID